MILDSSSINHQINSGEFSCKPCLTTPELLASDVFFREGLPEVSQMVCWKQFPARNSWRMFPLKHIYNHIYISNTCIHIYIYSIEYGCISNLQCCLMLKKNLWWLEIPAKNPSSSSEFSSKNPDPKGAVWKSWKLMSGSFFKSWSSSLTWKCKD
jgi:hypothetical protein